MQSQTPWIISLIAGIGWSGLGSLIAAFALLIAIQNAARNDRERRESRRAMIEAILTAMAPAIRRMRMAYAANVDDDRSGHIMILTVFERTLIRFNEFELPSSAALRAYHSILAHCGRLLERLRGPEKITYTRADPGIFEGDANVLLREFERLGGRPALPILGVYGERRPDDLLRSLDRLAGRFAEMEDILTSLASTKGAVTDDFRLEHVNRLIDNLSVLPHALGERWFSLPPTGFKARLLGEERQIHRMDLIAAVETAHRAVQALYWMVRSDPDIVAETSALFAEAAAAFRRQAELVKLRHPRVLIARGGPPYSL